MCAKGLERRSHSRQLAVVGLDDMQAAIIQRLAVGAQDLAVASQPPRGILERERSGLRSAAVGDELVGQHGHLLARVGGVVSKVSAPVAAAEHAQRGHDACGGDERGTCVRQRLVEEDEVDEIERDRVRLCILLVGAIRRLEPCRLGEALQEVCGFGVLHVKVESLQDFLFHLDNVPARRRVVGDVREVAEVGVVALLVLAAQHKGRHAHSLVLAARHGVACKIAVEQLDGEVQARLAEAEFEVHLH